MEETAAYALIADMDTDNVSSRAVFAEFAQRTSLRDPGSFHSQVSFFMGLTEISTGLGYMVGPPLGGMLFAAGGFATPFVVLGLALLPAAPPLAPTLGPAFPGTLPERWCVGGGAHLLSAAPG